MKIKEIECFEGKNWNVSHMFPTNLLKTQNHLILQVV